MAWHAPITWADGVVYDEDDFNAQLRDNLALLKLSRLDNGMLRGLSSAYLANLSPSNLTGLATLAAPNSYLAKAVFTGNGRVVIPAGADAALDAGPGAVWIEGVYFHWLDSSGDEWRFAGTLVASGTPGLPGSVWGEDNDVHYIDEFGADRKVTGSTSGLHSDVSAIGGSAWMEDPYLHWIRASGTQEYLGHADSHSDSGHSDSHSDVAHADSHTDATPHSDSHNDTSHVDSHADGHGDQNLPQHADVHTDQHNDNAHQDSHTDATPHSDSHTDGAHTDSHTDSGHGDSHSDTPEAVP